jgi:hypothetical protein
MGFGGGHDTRDFEADSYNWQGRSMFIADSSH